MASLSASRAKDVTLMPARQPSRTMATTQITVVAKSYSRSPEAKEYQKFYRLKLWAHKPTGLRWQCLVKALFKCQDCGWQAKASETHLLVADHIVPFRGDFALFSDPGNLVCLCSPCHSGAKQSEEKWGYSKKVALDGWPVDSNHPANKAG